MTESQKEIILNNLNKSSKELEGILKISHKKIIEYCKNNNIRLKHMKSSYDLDFFEKIDTEEKAYFLGLIYADGYILNGRKNRKESDAVGLALTDLDVLEKFKKVLNSNHPINIYQDSRNKNWKPTGRIIIYGEKITQDLISKGVLKNKSLILTFPSYDIVPKELISHFIRGYFDGDGHLGHYIIHKNINKFTLTLTGTWEMLAGIQDFFKTHVNFTQRFPEREKNNYTLFYTGRLQFFRILNILYSDATVYMDRKYNYYLDLKSKYSES